MTQTAQQQAASQPRKLLRKQEACGRLGISNSSFYVYIQNGWIKPGVPIGPRLKGWPEDEIDAYIQSCIAKRDEKNGGGAA